MASLWSSRETAQPTALDPGQRRVIAERYAVGETMAELAREYGCGEATIWRALRRNVSSRQVGEMIV